MFRISKFINKIFFFLLLFSSIVTQSQSNQNKILFKIDNEIITSIDILHEIEYRNILNKRISDLPKDRQFEIAKKSLIREKIKKIEASNFFVDINLNDEQLEPFLKEFIRKTNLKSKDQLQKLLKSKKIEFEIFKEKLKIEALWNQLILNKFSKNIKINKIKIKEDILKENTQMEYLLSEIVFSVENENYEKKYNEIKKEINQNGFEIAASTYSISDSSQEGGKLGWVKFNSLNDKIKNEISKINKKDVTKPIIIPSGFLILKINDEKLVENVKDIDLEVENVSRLIANKQLNQFSNIYFNKIKKKIDINEL